MCPAVTTFVMSNTIVLRAYLATPTGRSITTEITSNNFLNLGVPGSWHLREMIAKRPKAADWFGRVNLPLRAQTAPGRE